MMAMGVVRGIKALGIVFTLILIPFFGIQVYSESVEGATRAPETIIVDINGGGDYNSIQEAINNANEGDTIYVWAGIYCENIIINKSLILISNGTSYSIINGTGFRDIVSIESDLVFFKGFSITRKDDRYSVLCTGITLKNVQYCNISNNNFSNTKCGINLMNSNSNNIINNTFINTKINGIYLSNSNSNNIINNSFKSNNWINIQLSDSNSNIIKNNKMDLGGMSIAGSNISHWNTHTIDVTNTLNGKPICYWKNKTGGIVQSGIGQIILANCSNILIENQNFSYINNPIRLGFSNNNIIRNNSLTPNDEYIYLQNSHSNNFSNNRGGIFLSDSNFNTFSNYTRYKKEFWIELSNSHFCSFNNNKFNNGVINIYNCNSTIFINNTFISCGIELYGSRISYWDTHVFENNTVNGKPLYYMKNITGGKISDDIGQLILVNCSNLVIENKSFNAISYGITTGFSNNITICNNYFTNNSQCISIENSESIKIKNNSIVNNKHGISLYNSNYNIIENNNCSNNQWPGIFLSESSNYNTIKNNICNSNGELESWNLGIVISSSNYNLVVNNICNFNNGGGIELRGDLNFIRYNICKFNKGFGIRVFGTKKNIIKNNTCSNNMEGISSYGDLNEFVNNSCTFNQKAGISFEGKLNKFESNIISYNENGVIVRGHSNYNIIFNNIISENSDKGFDFCSYAENNFIFHNNIFLNSKQAIDEGSNFWNNSAHQGNYWSDYTGVDNGANGRPKGDGIGDTKIPHQGVDYYPFVNPELAQNGDGGDGGDGGDNGRWWNLPVCRTISILVIILILVLFLILRGVLGKKKNKKKY